ncbi:MAG: outer membrane beta-barrel protein [Raineya sp.]|nr:outer membrane beta-barrel protein [Raineya sp.]
MRKNLILFFVCILSLNSFSQGHITHLDDYDEKPMHYGFVLGLNHSWFSIKTSPNAFSNQIINDKPAWGFSVGLAATYQPAELLAIRLSPTAVFGQRIIQFQNAITQQITEKVVETTIADFPLMLKIKSLRRHNARMFMIAGIKPHFSLGTKLSQEPERIRIRNTGFSVEYGFGIERFYEMFKFAPEIRFTHTFGNLLIPDDNQFSSQIRSLSSHSVSVYLFFE